jgi:hypothetical protein
MIFLAAAAEISRKPPDAGSAGATAAVSAVGAAVGDAVSAGLVQADRVNSAQISAAPKNHLFRLSVLGLNRFILIPLLPLLRRQRRVAVFLQVIDTAFSAFRHRFFAALWAAETHGSAPGRGVGRAALAPRRARCYALYIRTAKGAANMWDDDKRFERIYKQGGLSVSEIWVDTKTGVNYLFHASGYAGGLSPLLDADGKPVVSPEYVR